MLDPRWQGRQLAGRYRLDSQLGAGGMGVVLLGQHSRTGRVVAIKVLHPHLSARQDVVERFLREARAAAKTAHPNVVDVLDADQDGSDAFMVMERLRGPTLTELTPAGGLSSSEALGAMMPILDALAACHEAGIVHRDVKPSNILMHRDATGAEVPKLLDFGVAKVSEAHTTQTGEILGTPMTMSPEQARGRVSVGPASDVWSWAATLYYLLEGERPVGGTASEILAALVRDARPTFRGEKLPADLREVLDRCFERDPGVRWPNARALQRALLPRVSEVVPMRSPAALDVTLMETDVGTGPARPRVRRRVVSMLLLLLLAALTLAYSARPSTEALSDESALVAPADRATLLPSLESAVEPEPEPEPAAQEAPTDGPQGVPDEEEAPTSVASSRPRERRPRSPRPSPAEAPPTATMAAVPAPDWRLP